MRMRSYGPDFRLGATVALLGVLAALSPPPAAGRGSDAWFAQDSKDDPSQEQSRANRRRQAAAKAKAARAQRTESKKKPRNRPPAPKPKIDPELRKRIEEAAKTAALRAEQAKKGATTRRAAPNPAERQPGRPGRPGAPAATTPLNIPPIEDENEIPPEKRIYTFSCKDCTYQQLVEGFARRTGLGVIGEAPKDGKVNFVPTEPLTFQEVLGRIRMLLFNYKPLEPYWLERYDTHLAVERINDLYRRLRPDQMYTSVDKFRAAQVSEDELALVIFTLKTGNLEDLRIVRDFMPDYFRVAPLDGQSVTIFGLVRDINKYLDLVPIFVSRKGDPRTIEVIPVEHVLPSEAVSRLETLMGSGGGGSGPPRSPARRRGAKEPNPMDTLRTPSMILMPDDAQGVLIVRAMRDKIDEIRRLLPYIDVDASDQGIEPVVIPVEHADVRELLDTIQQILAAYGQQPESRESKKRSRGRRTQPKATVERVTAEGITLFVHPTGHAIVAVGNEEEVARVRQLVQQFDVAAQVGPIRLTLQYANANEAASTITGVLGGGGGKSKALPAGLHLMPDPAGKALWYMGSEHDLKTVRELIAIVDVEDEAVTLHVVTLRRQQPSFVAGVLKEFDRGEGSKVSVTTTSRAKRPKPVSVSKFTANDDQKTLYVLCTETEWAAYQVVIDQLEAAVEEPPPFVRLPVQHLDPDAAIERLHAVFGGHPDTAAVRYAPSDGAVLVFGASPSSLEDIRAYLAEVDRPVTVEQRRFQIRHREAADIKAAIELLVGGGSSAATSRRPRSGPKGKGSFSVAGSVLPELSVFEFGDRLIVRTTPEKMEEVAALIAELDVPDTGTEMKVYDDFPPGSDIEAMADILASVVGGARPSSAGRNPKKMVRGTLPEGPRFIPQPAAGRLVVIAQPDVFPEIEQLLGVLRTGVDVKPYVTEFIDLRYADPDELVELTTPLLELKARELVRAGRLQDVRKEGPGRPSSAVVKRGSPAGGTFDHFYIRADARNRRLVLAAPEALLAEARTLVARFDVPDAHALEFRTVDLANAEPAEMVRALKEMMGSSARRASRKPARKGGTVEDIFDGSRLSVVEAPGGRAVILQGPVKAVDKATEWIKQLDAISTRGRAVKVYQIQYADLIKLGELIINVVDTPMPAKGRPRRVRKATPAPPEEGEFELSKTWTGQEIYIQADLVAGSMIVAAPQGKIAEIDKIVAQFDTEEGQVRTEEIPKLTYELEHRDAFDAVFDLDMLLEAMWDPPDELPKVDSSPFGDMLVIRYPHKDRFPEIEELIRKYIDKPKPGENEVKKKGFAAPPGISARDTALWLKMNHPELDVEIIDVSTTKDKTWGVERLRPAEPGPVNPCVLPLSLTRMAGDGVLGAVGSFEPEEDRGADARAARQDAATDPPKHARSDRNPEDLVRAAAKTLLAKDRGASSAAREAERRPSGPSGPAAGQDKKVRIFVDDATGAVTVEGQAGLLDEVPDWLDELKEEIDELPRPPDIRIFRVRYVDVFTAAEVLEEMFNATRRQRQQLQQQQRQAAQRARQQQQQQQRQANKGQQPGQTPRSGPRGRPPQQPTGVAQLPPTTVRVFPNPRDRTLILRADTSQFPAILELLATIDRPQPIASKFRVFKLDKLAAGDVEALLKDMLGVEQKRSSASGRRGGASARRRTGGGSRFSGQGGQLPETIMQDMVTGEGAVGIDPKDIKLTSHEETNTIIVMAPPAALDYIAELIRQLESEEIPERVTKYYQLKQAEVEGVAEYLESHFAIGGEGDASRKGGAVAIPPSVVSYPRLNLLSVLGTTEQLTEIDGIVERLDVPSDQEQWEHVTLVHADAGEVADTLSQMFSGAPPGRKGGRRAPASGGSGPKFVGEEGSRILLFSAPPALHEQIRQTIEQLEAETADQTTLRVLTLEHAKPSDLAEAIEDAYGLGRKGKMGRGGAPPKFSVTPHDASHRLFVRADEQTFSEIESLVRSLDQPGKVGFDFRIYPLQYANARQVHTQMTTLMSNYIKNLDPAARKAMEAFSVEVDDRANALVVLGSPSVFAFLEENLPKIDTPAAQVGQPGFITIPVENADAQELAQNIRQLWSEKTLPPGETPPRVQANRSLNVLIVKGTQAQLEEIKNEVIQPLEEQAQQSLLTETITLQHADPAVVADSINRIFEDKKRAYQGTRSGSANPLEFAVVVTPDVTTRQVIVQASEPNLALVKARIAEMDREEVVAGSVTTMTIYPVQHANPADVAKIINDWARSRPKPVGRGAAPSASDAVVAMAEPATQTVVVAASAANHEIVRELIEGLDDDTLATQAIGGVVRVVPLLYSDANEMHQAMQEYLRRPGGGGRGRGGELAGSVRLSVLAQSNALVVSGSKEEVDGLESTIRQLDVAGEEGSVPQILRLKYVSAGDVAPSIQKLFEGRRGGPRTKTAPVIVPSADTLIVRADPTDLSAIRSLVKQLDTEEERPENFRLIQVASGINVTDLAEKVENTINDSALGRAGRGEALRVTVTPDTRTNSLILAGAVSLFDDTEKLVRQLENTGPSGAKSIRIVKLGKVPFDEIQRLVDQLKGEEPGKSRSRRRATGGRRGRPSQRSQRSRSRSQPRPRRGRP